MSQTAQQSLLDAARSAVERRAWSEAHTLYADAQSSGELTAEDYDGMAEAAWWTGRLEESLTARQQAYSGYLAANETRRAATCAIQLAADYKGKLAHSMSGGWAKRAERLLENDTDCREYGWLTQFKAYVAAFAGNYDEVLGYGEKLLELGTKFSDPDLLAYGVLAQGKVKLARGEVEEGLELLDEATLAAVSGELSFRATGLVYCMAIATTASLREYRRAGEWTEAAKRWCERQSITGFPGICRVHRAQIMHLRGEWTEAEQDVRLAVNELKDFNMVSAGEGFYELGEIRLRTGDLKGAAEAFRQAEALGRQPDPGIAMLRLAEGDVAAAVGNIKRALAEEVPMPLHRFPLVHAEGEIALAAGDIKLAEAASKELDEISGTYCTPAFLAAAGSVRGAISIARRDAAAAIDTLREAIRQWKEADVPYEIARTRVLLAEAYDLAGEPELAQQEREVARSAFVRLGAMLDLRNMGGANGHKVDAEAARTKAVKTFMFTDIVKSTNLIEAIGDDAWSHLLEWHNKTLRALFLAHLGEEVKQVGDGFFVVFDRFEDAMECAVGIQRSLADHRRNAGFAPQVRIGLHAGEAARRGSDYEGGQIHLAARIGAAAGAGEIVVSASAAEGGSPAYRLSEARPVTLKGINEPVSIVSVDWR